MIANDFFNGRLAFTALGMFSQWKSHSNKTGIFKDLY